MVVRVAADSLLAPGDSPSGSRPPGAGPKRFPEKC